MDGLREYLTQGVTKDSLPYNYLWSNPAISTPPCKPHLSTCKVCVPLTLRRLPQLISILLIYNYISSYGASLSQLILILIYGYNFMYVLGSRAL